MKIKIEKLDRGAVIIFRNKRFYFPVVGYQTLDVWSEYQDKHSRFANRGHDSIDDFCGSVNLGLLVWTVIVLESFIFMISWAAFSFGAHAVAFSFVIIGNIILWFNFKDCIRHEMTMSRLEKTLRACESNQDFETAINSVREDA